jgi:spore coat protein U-like protein
MNRISARVLSLFAATVISLMPDLAHAINCRVTIGAMNFGLYKPLTQTHLDVMGQVTVRCQSQPGSFTITMGPGVSGDQTARTMLSTGATVLNYNLYRDAARTQIWGDGTPPTFVVSGVRPSKGRPTFYNYPIYGRIFANQVPDPGLYSDTPIVTVLF